MAPLQTHVSAIHELLNATVRVGILLWLDNGWAYDADKWGDG